MSKYIVVVFPNESKAYEGSRAFSELHNEGNLTLYGIAVIQKNADGAVTMKKAEDEGPVGTAVGMLVGGMLGVLGGPAGVVLGATSGALVGSIGDLSNAGMGIDFVEMVGAKMVPGTTAAVAEVDEYWMAPLDTRMENLEGIVFRRARYDFEDEQYRQEALAWKAEMDELRQEIKEASDEMKAKLEAKRDAVRTQLNEAADKGKQKIDQLEKEAKAKIVGLEKQAAEAKSDAKAKIQKRMEEVRNDYHARDAKLREAGELIREALAA